MDKVKQILAILKKHQFWVICGAVLLITVVCWWLASMGLAGQFQKRKATLEKHFKDVVIQPGHPNPDMVEKIHDLHDQLKLGVFKAWETLYSEQKKKNPFPNELGPDFKEEFERLKQKDKEELDTAYRELYQNFILRHIPALLKMVDVRRPADEKDPAPGDARTGSTGRPEPEHSRADGSRKGPRDSNEELPALAARGALGWPAE